MAVMKTLPKILFFILFLAVIREGNACTTFIISGKATPDGRPVLFKHRDADVLDNALHLFEDGQYRYLGLVNSREDRKTMVWGGFNSTGFAIINSAAYNNNTGDTTRLKDREGIIMKRALMVCRTLADFENLLDTLPKPLGVDANFGVIDAQGGASYYETGNFRWIRYDVNDPAVAPKGFLVRTNHSFSGTPDAGYGYVRYNTAMAALEEAAEKRQFNPRYLFDHISRNLTHSLTGKTLGDHPARSSSSSDFRFFIDYIPRVSTAASILITGAGNRGDVSSMTMWTILGFPLVSVAVPVWLTEGNILPAAVSMKNDFHSPLCDAAMKLRESCFPVTRDKGQNYINMAAVINRENSGFMQLLRPVEDTLFKKASQVMGGGDQRNPPEKAVTEFYRWMDSFLEREYQKLFGIALF